MHLFAFRILCTVLLAFLVSACTPFDAPQPLSGTEIREVIKIVEPCPAHKLNVIGSVEPVVILPMTVSLPARIDTGAETSSLGVSNMTPFERDGEKWVAFDVVDPDSKTTERFEKKIARKTSIKRINGDEDRTVVSLTIRFGTEIIETEFTLADRSKFAYPVLIGRNIISGRAIVDVSEENTLLSSLQRD